MQSGRWSFIHILGTRILFRGGERHIFLDALCRSRKDIFRPLVSVIAKCFSLSIAKVCQKLNIKNLVSLLLDK